MSCAPRSSTATASRAAGSAVNCWQQEFGASWMPIMALRALEAEGLVRVKAHSGAWVAGLDLEEFEQCYKLREVVEPMVIRESLPNLLEEQIERAHDRSPLRRPVGRRACATSCGWTASSTCSPTPVPATRS